MRFSFIHIVSRIRLGDQGMVRLRRTAGAFVAMMLFVGTGCSTNGDSMVEPKNNVTTLPWTVRFNYKAMTIAVGQSVPLHATVLDVNGDTMPDQSGIVYTSTDTSLHIDATGKVTATRPVGLALIYARVQNLSQNWTISDTAKITVTQTPYVFSSLKMVLDGPTLLPAGEWRNFDTNMFDQNGYPVVDDSGKVIYPITYYTPSAGRDIFNQYDRWNGGASGTNLGNVTVRAAAYMFGRVYTDSVNFKITYTDDGVLYIYPVSYNMNPSPSKMTQTDLTVLRNGDVRFYNQNYGVNTSVTFADTINTVGGVIPVVAGWPGSMVVFPKVGKYKYTTSIGYSGTITVVDP